MKLLRYAFAFPPLTLCSKVQIDWFCTGMTLDVYSHVSFVDCPGHDILMATMLNGAAVMDAALLLIAANETCPQPQTSEHLAAIEIMKLKHILVLQVRLVLGLSFLVRTSLIVMSFGGEIRTKLI